MFSFHQRAIQLLCTDLKWAPDLLETFRTASCDLRLTLITWVVEDHASLNTHFKELIQSVLQVSYRLKTVQNLSCQLMCSEERIVSIKMQFENGVSFNCIKKVSVYSTSNKWFHNLLYYLQYLDLDIVLPILLLFLKYVTVRIF